MNLKEKLFSALSNFNEKKSSSLAIDTIRISFTKYKKLYQLEHLGVWHKVKPNTRISTSLKKRLEKKEYSSAYQLDDYRIYYYNTKESNYKKSVMVMYGLKQYDDKLIPNHLIDEILTILNRLSSVDICYDFNYKPNLSELKLKVDNYKKRNQTFYINETNNPLIDHICIYNKAFKNELAGVLYRIEFKALIKSVRGLYLPLDDIYAIITDIQKATMYNRINAKGRNV